MHCTRNMIHITITIQQMSACAVSSDTAQCVMIDILSQQKCTESSMNESDWLMNATSKLCDGCEEFSDHDESVEAQVTM
jgi:hypothetical protein